MFPLQRTVPKNSNSRDNNHSITALSLSSCSYFVCTTVHCTLFPISSRLSDIFSPLPIKNAHCRQLHLISFSYNLFFFFFRKESLDSKYLQKKIVNVIERNSCCVVKDTIAVLWHQENSKIAPKTRITTGNYFHYLLKLILQDMKLVGTCWKMSNKGSGEEDK